LVAYPLFLFWGHIPQGPLGGGSAPSTPSFFPTLVCWGFARALSPTRWQGYRGWLLAPDFIFVGDTPMPPSWGLRPPVPPSFCPPSFAEGLPRFWVPLGGGLVIVSSLPLVFVLGAHPPRPPGRGRGPLHPQFFSHPRLLRVHQRPGSHSVAGLHELAISPYF